MVNEGLCEQVGCEVTGGAGAALIHTMRAAGLTRPAHARVDLDQ